MKILIGATEEARPDKKVTDRLTKIQEPIRIERDSDEICNEVIGSGKRNNAH